MVYVWKSFNWRKILQAGRHAHDRKPCQVWTIFDTIRKLRHVQPFIGTFFTEKTPENGKNYRKLKQIGMVPKCSWNNFGVIWQCQKTCSQTETSVLPENTPLNMAFFWNFFVLRAGGRHKNRQTKHQTEKANQIFGLLCWCWKISARWSKERANNAE